MFETQDKGDDHEKATERISRTQSTNLHGQLKHNGSQAENNDMHSKGSLASCYDDCAAAGWGRIWRR